MAKSERRGRFQVALLIAIASCWQTSICPSSFDLYRRMREKNESIPIASITGSEIVEDEFSKMMPSAKVKDFTKNPIRIPSLP
ncbi:MAG TPA: hypothetical protein VF172_03535 [Nitrososphaera sp.]